MPSVVQSVTRAVLWIALMAAILALVYMLGSPSLKFDPVVTSAIVQFVGSIAMAAAGYAFNAKGKSDGSSG